MKTYAIAAATALALNGTAAAAQNAGPQSVPQSAPQSVWAYFEGEGGLMQAGVQNAQGAQLIFKCDEAGDNTVYAVVFSPTRLRPPGPRPQVRPLTLRFDDGARDTFTWRYYDQTVVALNTRRDSTLPPFVAELVNATRLEVGLQPVDGSPFQLNFTVTGAREAIDRVFASCGDSANPLNSAQ
jgi:hypothetical protein